MHRVLKKGGTYLLVSFGAPPSRLRLLEVLGDAWTIRQQPVTKPKSEQNDGPAAPEHGMSSPYHYVYICVRQK